MSIQHSKSGFFVKAANIRAIPSLVKMDMMGRGGPVYQNAGLELLLEATFYLTDAKAGEKLARFFRQDELALNALVDRWYAEQGLVDAVSRPL